jgi:hypothetical protein
VSAPTDGRSWSTTQMRLPSGAFESVQSAAFPSPVVQCSKAGAARLGDVYWRVVRSATFGVVRPRTSARGLEVRLLGLAPALLRFGSVEHGVQHDSVSCVYPIRGGLLARAAGGSLTFTQTGSTAVEVTSAITDFFPRLAVRRERRRWKGLLYPHVQARLHVVLSRRYFERLWQEAQ